MLDTHVLMAETSSEQTSLEAYFASILSKKDLSFRLTASELTCEILSTIQISNWPQAVQQALRIRLNSLIQAAFPNMTSQDVEQTVDWYFQQPQEGFQRQAILVKESSGELMALTLFDMGVVEYHHRQISAIYIINCTVRPAYQGYGMGQALAACVFFEWSPDILLITCSQSSSLYSWITLAEKGFIQDYVVYPAVRNTEAGKTIVVLPYSDIDLVLACFQPLYLGIMQGDVERLDRAIRNMTVRMLRKNCYQPMYAYDPWEKDGRSDMIARELGATASDGILAVFEKKRGFCDFG